jgi:hypothetical protein
VLSEWSLHHLCLVTVYPGIRCIGCYLLPDHLWCGYRRSLPRLTVAGLHYLLLNRPPVDALLPWPRLLVATVRVVPSPVPLLAPPWLCPRPARSSAEVTCEASEK